VHIFVCKDLYFIKINILLNYKEKDLEICGIELEANASTLNCIKLIQSMYRRYKHRLSH
jgi:hypothetical protein